MKQTISTSIVLETRTPLKDGSFPVKLRLIFHRQSRYYSLNYSWEKYPAVMTALKDFTYLIDLHKKNVDVGVPDDIPTIQQDFIAGN
jgi:hypothetical protein